MVIIFRLALGIVGFTALLVPSAIADMSDAIRSIHIETHSNAVAISWEGMSTASRYKIYYSKKSILGSNGRFDDTEETQGNDPSLILLDLKNRGFTERDTIYVTVTAVDMQGKENVSFVEEASASVQVPGTEPRHAAAGIFSLENAIAESQITVRLRFSHKVTPPTEHPASTFTIEDMESGDIVNVFSLRAEETDILLDTSPMTPRKRYTVTVAGTLKAQDGSVISETKRSQVFVARGENDMETNQDPTPAPPAVTPDPVPTPDTTPPEDPMNLTLKRILQPDGKYTVEANWSHSPNTANDLASYNLYESANRGITYVGPAALRSTVTSTSIGNVPPGTLTVRLAALDRSGNESKGIMKIIILPETGAGLSIALSMIGALAYSARKRKSADTMHHAPS